MKNNPLKPEICHYQATLRKFHKVTTSLSNDECPPLNVISLPCHQRNLYIPPKFGCLALHEVAQSRLPLDYKTLFEVPNLKSHLEWSLIGGKGAVSPFHVDSIGFGTAVVILEGSKYWIVMTQMGERPSICSVDSLGPGWNSYFLNKGDKAKNFHFKGLHLQHVTLIVILCILKYI